MVRKQPKENLSWYNTAPTGTHTEINVSTVNHKNLIGNYTTHVYVDYVDNTEDGFNLGETALAPRNRRGEPQTTYYSQRDPRWASKWYGVSNMDQSGCVPTSLAMTFYRYFGNCNCTNDSCGLFTTIQIHSIKHQLLVQTRMVLY